MCHFYEQTIVHTGTFIPWAHLYIPGVTPRSLIHGNSKRLYGSKMELQSGKYSTVTDLVFYCRKKRLNSARRDGNNTDFA